MSKRKELFEKMLSSISQIKKAVKDRTSTTNQDEIKKTISEMVSQNRRSLVEEAMSQFRKGEFTLPNEDREPMPQVVEKSDDPKVQSFQNWQDTVYLTSKILRVHPRHLNIWQRQSGSVSELKKAMDTATSGEGSEWIPTEFSAQLIDRVRLALKVAALFPRVPMPSNPFKIPVVSSDATAKLIGESTGDSATKISASTPGTRQATLTAKKLAARVLFSEEMSEDSIVATSDFVKQNIAIALAFGLEDALINGDDSATHQDSNVTDSTDARKAFQGLRKLTQSGNKVTCTTFNLTNVRTIRLKMGKYGTDPSQLAWITGPAGLMQLMNLTEVVTVDKYGQFATVLNGEIGRLDGIPIIVSEKVQEDLNTSGVYDGTTTNNTILILAHRNAFTVGDRRRLTVKTFEDIQTDQTIVVASQRNAFTSYYDTTTESVVAQGVDVSTSL